MVNTPELYVSTLPLYDDENEAEARVAVVAHWRAAVEAEGCDVVTEPTVALLEAAVIEDEDGNRYRMSDFVDPETGAHVEGPSRLLRAEGLVVRRG